MKFTKRLISALLITSVLVGGFIYYNNKPYRSVALMQSTEWKKASDTKKISILKQSAKKQVATVEEASKDLNFQLKKPLNTLNKNLLGVFISDAPKGEEGREKTHFLYEGGLLISEVPVDSQPDYSAIIKEMTQNKKDGILKADKVPGLITINGCTGVGVEPGYNVFDDGKLPRSGFVEWWQNGVSYTVLGNQNTPLTDLIKVAESMENAN